MRLLGSRSLAWFLPIYALMLLFAAPHLSFWLDEVLTLSAAREPNLSSMLVNLEKQQGATPLAFLIPRWAIQIFGMSLLSARLPSILAAVAACPAVFTLAKRAGVRKPMAAVLVFALWPLQVRYALEVRPYALAVCLSAWLTVLFVDRSHRVLYGALVIALAMTHPYGLFLPLAHLVWAMLYSRDRAPVPALALAVSAMVLAPWYLHFQDGWRAMSARQQLGPTNWAAPLAFVRELTGSGYAGAVVLAIGLWFARSVERLWWWMLAVPIIAVPLANITFDYFYAVRQFIFLVPLFALLFVAGTDRWGTCGRWLLAGLLAASLYSDARWFLRPREDWAAASDAISKELQAGCVRFVGDSEKLFVVFRNELGTQVCSATSNRVIVAGSAYESDTDTRAARPVGTLVKRTDFNGPWIEVYSR